jgi:hypothetical protein
VKFSTALATLIWLLWLAGSPRHAVDDVEHRVGLADVLGELVTTGLVGRLDGGEDPVVEHHLADGELGVVVGGDEERRDVGVVPDARQHKSGLARVRSCADQVREARAYPADDVVEGGDPEEPGLELLGQVGSSQPGWRRRCSSGEQPPSFRHRLAELGQLVGRAVVTVRREPAPLVQSVHDVPVVLSDTAGDRQGAARLGRR